MLNAVMCAKQNETQRVRLISCAEKKLVRRVENGEGRAEKQKCQLCSTRFETIELPESFGFSYVFSVIIV